MHIIHGNAAAMAGFAGGLFDPDDADLVDGEPPEEPEMRELEITVGGQQSLMLLVALWTNDQGAVIAAAPIWAIDQGPEFKIEATVSGVC